ncbi:MAG: hypothetical protein M3Q65_05235 [Chloroflexota bacterium]|nr:hypothetical protein [Chloroflexota bacterium]
MTAQPSMPAGTHTQQLTSAMLPAAPTGLVPTPNLAQARALAQALLEGNEIGLLEGPAGTGKMSSAAQIAHKAGRPCAFVTMGLPARPVGPAAQPDRGADRPRAEGHALAPAAGPAALPA